MTLNDCDLDKVYKVLSIQDLEEKVTLRLYEIGLFLGSEIKVLNKSFSNKTLLVQILDSCFVLKEDISKHIKVNNG